MCVAFSLLMSVYRLQFTFGWKYSFFSDTWTTFAINKKKEYGIQFYDVSELSYLNNCNGIYMDVSPQLLRMCFAVILNLLSCWSHSFSFFVTKYKCNLALYYYDLTEMKVHVWLASHSIQTHRGHVWQLVILS